MKKPRRQRPRNLSNLNSTVMQMKRLLKLRLPQALHCCIATADIIAESVRIQLYTDAHNRPGSWRLPAGCWCYRREEQFSVHIKTFK